MRDFQIPVRGVIVADEAEAVAADRDGCVLSDIPFTMKSRPRGRRADHLFTVNDFEISVRRIVVTHEGLAIHSYRHRTVLTDIAGFIGSRGERWFRAGHIRAES